MDTTLNPIDPICGMRGTLPHDGYLFCSQSCIERYEARTDHPDTEKSDHAALDTHPKQDNVWIAHVLIAVIIVGGILSWWTSWMQEFMGGFFVVVAILKLIDLSGFAQAYAQYDIITQERNTWGYLYPWIELGLGIGFLTHPWHGLTSYLAIITLILMIVGTWGVARQLLQKNKFRCACLGTKLNIPLTNLTLVEDILMGLMALMLLF